MTDDEESEEPAVTLGTQQAVEGAPLARVSARLMWGIEKSTVREREGETVIRTPDGPQQLEDLLAAVDSQYFATRQEFEDALGEVIGEGAVPVEADDTEENEAESDEAEADDTEETEGDETEAEESETEDGETESDEEE